MDYVVVMTERKTTKRFLSLTVKRPLTMKRATIETNREISRNTNFHFASTKGFSTNVQGNPLILYANHVLRSRVVTRETVPCIRDVT